MAFTVKKLLLEADFLNGSFTESFPIDIYYDFDANRQHGRTLVDKELITKFFETEVDEFWHSDKDQLEFIQFFNDGMYFCQRRKTVYDFSNNTSYPKVYSFTSATKEQAEAFYTQVQDFFFVVKEVANLKVEEKVKEIDSDIVHWEQRWRKLYKQKHNMLELSDWRVLPDITEKYTGEKDDWVKWRQWLRDKSLPSPTDPMFDDENGESSGLKYFKYTHELKFPVDPKNYRKLYPNGKLDDGVTDAPAFMDENDADQWVETQEQASNDFWKSNEENLWRLAQRGERAKRKVTTNILKLMKDLDVDDLVPVDWDKFYTDENEL